MEERLGASVAPRRFSVVTLGAFAAGALLLAAIGLYGLQLDAWMQPWSIRSKQHFARSRPPDCRDEMVEAADADVSAGTFGYPTTCSTTRSCARQSSAKLPRCAMMTVT